MPAEAIGLIASLVVLVIALAMAAGGRSREEPTDERHCPHYMIPGRSPRGGRLSQVTGSSGPRGPT